MRKKGILEFYRFVPFFLKSTPQDFSRRKYVHPCDNKVSELVHSSTIDWINFISVVGSF